MLARSYGPGRLRRPLAFRGKCGSAAYDSWPNIVILASDMPWPQRKESNDDTLDGSGLYQVAQKPPSERMMGRGVAVKRLVFPILTSSPLFSVRTSSTSPSRRGYTRAGVAP